MSEEYTYKSFTGALELLRDICNGKAQENISEVRKDVFRTEGQGWIVDTVKGFDTGVWETGIESPTTNGNFHIAEQYESRDLAEAGHNKWVKLMQEKPNSEIPNINVWETM